MGIQKVPKKNAVKANFKLVANGIRNEIMKCEIGSDKKPFDGYKGLDCPITINSSYTYIAQWFSYENGIRNPINGQLAVRPGDGEKDGEVSIVVCPRSPYCSSNSSTNGKWKVMWWWDNETLQDYEIIKKKVFAKSKDGAIEKITGCVPTQNFKGELVYAKKKK